MAASIKFYQSLGLKLTYGGPKSPFSTLGLGGADNTLHVNLFKPDQDKIDAESWGRVIIYVSDVDKMAELARSSGYKPEFDPKDAPWGERYFHIRDPSGHELSFAKKIQGHRFWNRKEIQPTFDEILSAHGKKAMIACAAGAAALLIWQSRC